jgi:hypothetical protein
LRASCWQVRRSLLMYFVTCMDSLTIFLRFEYLTDPLA